MTFHKLVRDRIPEILQAKGMIAETRTLEGHEYLRALHAKLIEEAGELDRALTSDDLKGELADVLEVIDELKKSYNFSDADLAEAQRTKRAERGGFDKHIFLTGTRDAN